MKIAEYIEKLEELGACQEAREDALKYESSQKLWDACERGDWMLWLAGKLAGKPESEKRKKLVLTCCQCARLSLKYVKKGETRPLKAIETAEAWARGESVTIQDVHAAAAAAADAAYAAYAAAADAAAAAHAAYAAAAAAAAADAADAAYAAADAQKNTLKECADIIREYYPNIDELWI
jgi:hypothetical protein